MNHAPEHGNYGGRTGDLGPIPEPIKKAGSYQTPGLKECASHVSSEVTVCWRVQAEHFR